MLAVSNADRLVHHLHHRGDTVRRAGGRRADQVPRRVELVKQRHPFRRAAGELLRVGQWLGGGDHRLAEVRTGRAGSVSRSAMTRPTTVKRHS